MTTKLSDLHYVLLAAAANRESGSLLPPSASVTSPRASITKAIRTLIGRGLADEVDTSEATAVWREEGERKIGVVITDAGRAAIAVADGKPVEPPPAPEPDPAPPTPDAAATRPATRPATKQELIIGMLQRQQGASLAELIEATGWLPHTTRAALTGLRKKGHAVITDKSGEATRYRVGGAA
jgi:DNA-binding MarR family transcriptional regulator